MMKTILATILLIFISTPSFAQDAQQQAVPEIQNAVQEGAVTQAVGTDTTAPVVDGQAVVTEEPPVPSSMEEQIDALLALQKPTVDPNAMPSLFFTVWEHDLLLDARRGLTTRAIDAPDDGVDPQNQMSVTVGPRDIALGGIIYRGKKDWVIWLNSMRISPDAIPSEIVDLKVNKNYIELEWFDASTRQIFPIRLRPHQRFNLDTRMFLPG